MARARAYVEIAGEAVPQGMPKHVVSMWQNPQMLKIAVSLGRKGSTDIQGR